jgi:hypothetical protein
MMRLDRALSCLLAGVGIILAWQSVQLAEHGRPGLAALAAIMAAGAGALAWIATPDDMR